MIFWPVDVQRILQIPIARANVEDFVAWHYNKSGLFSVRSAYHVEWEFQHGEKLRHSHGTGPTQVHPIWKKLWKLKLPGKVKIFAWKGLYNRIPCLATLANRHVPVSAQCLSCPTEVEDLRHVLFTCSQARAVWTALDHLDIINQSLCTDRAGSMVLEDLLGGSNAHKTYMGPITNGELAAVACWYIWWERRQLRKGESIQTPPRSAMAIQALAMNYVRAYSKPTGSDRHGWRRPPEGMQKLNIDASFIEDLEEGATGAVVRDANGAFVGAMNSMIPVVYDATMAETLALQRGIYFAQSLGCSNLLINSDCSEVVHEMTSGNWPSSPAAAIYIDCLKILKDFGKVIMEHCPRDSNKVAHELARVARIDPPNVWLDNPPSFILPLLIDDVTLV